MRLRAHIERECVYRKRPRLYRNAPGIISFKSPPHHRLRGASPPQSGGEAFWLGCFQVFQPSPWGSLTVAEGNFDHPVNGQKVNERAARSAPGQGTARNERWMRDASDILMLLDSVTLMLQRAYLLGYVSRSGFSDLRDRGSAPLAARAPDSSKFACISRRPCGLALLACARVLIA